MMAMYIINVDVQAGVDDVHHPEVDVGEERRCCVQEPTMN